MNRVINETNWTKFLKDYSSRNEDRPTRLGVFEKYNGNANDFWIEDGLPLIALDAYPNKDRICVDILFENYKHQIDGVERIVDIEGEVGDQGLDIADASGRTTILRFEDWPLRKEN
jgi:hypothetical protein